MMKLETGNLKFVMVALVAALLAGCVVIGDGQIVARANVLTSRTSLSETSGSSNRVDAVSGMEGGGTVAPETTVTPTALP